MAEPVGSRLLAFLRSAGAQTPAALMASLGVSQPTLFRSAVAQKERIIALGARRNRKLAALRSVRNAGARFPLFRISSDGEVAPLGSFVAVYPGSFVLLMNSDPLKPLYFSGLPFFLDDVRPQGFFGRSFGQKHPELNLPDRISDWRSDDIVEALARRGEDLMGNLLLGAESFERYQAHRRRAAEPVKVAKPEQQYVRYAQAAIDGEPAGSSAGGEHPKFGATLQFDDGTLKRVLVKFSPLGETFSSQRWRDLLICEWIALDLLRTHGIAAPEARIIEAGGRIFLETVRFDRRGAHGRMGILSLSALENEWTGHGGNWAASAKLLTEEKRITEDDLEAIQFLECFGRLIANSDRHPGNLSFFWEPGESKAVLAPVYDMLPMLYAPSSGGEDTGKTFVLPTYDHTLLNAWRSAMPLALEYWRRVREDMRISATFRKIANANRVLLSEALE